MPVCLTDFRIEMGITKKPRRGLFWAHRDSEDPDKPHLCTVGFIVNLLSLVGTLNCLSEFVECDLKVMASM